LKVRFGGEGERKQMRRRKNDVRGAFFGRKALCWGPGLSAFCLGKNGFERNKKENMGTSSFHNKRKRAENKT